MSTSLEQARFNMIEQQIRPWDVLETRVLDLLKIVKREQYVPTALKSLAFVDTELPLGFEQTMLSPKLEARLFQAAGVSPGDRVLEIGTGSGYMAALLGYSAAAVVSFETHAELATQAQTNLHAGLLDNVVVHTGCGFAGQAALAGERGWDVVMLSGSIPSMAALPAALLDALTIGGRIIAVVGDERISPMMNAQILRKTAPAEYDTRILFDTAAPALSGIARPLFSF